MIKLKVIMENQSHKLENKVIDFFSVKKNIIKTFYATCSDEGYIYFTAFIEYRVTDE